MEKQGKEQLTANKKTILIVEDDATILKFLSCCLNDDFTVLTADRGENALQQSQTFAGQINLLLTDILLPKMNGVQLAIEITAHRPGIKVVLMTGFAGELLLPDPEWSYLPKPFKHSQLINLVNSVLSSPTSSSAGA